MLAVLGTQRFKRFVDAGMELSVAGALVGIFLGWRSVLALGCASAVLFLVQSLLRRPFPRLPVAAWSVWFAVTTALCVLVHGRPIDWLSAAARTDSWMLLLTGGLLTAAVLSLLARLATEPAPKIRTYTRE